MMIAAGVAISSALAVAMAFTSSSSYSARSQHNHSETRRSMTNNNIDATQPVSSFAGAFDIDRMDALATRGELEASLMQRVGVLGEDDDAKKNYGKNKKKRKPKEQKRQKASVAARALFQDGVVRLNGLLSTSTASSLRDEILERRDAAYAAVKSSTNADGESWRKYFADVLLKGDKNQRCDLLLPLKGNHNLQLALHELLTSKSNLLLGTLAAALGGRDDAILYELSALISEPGSSRQPVHPDNPHQEETPLFTAFVALQDIDENMGPTSFIPRTHNAESHATFDDVPDGRDELLRSRKSVVALLKSGDASLFDSRCLHCGGANDATSGSTRVLLYVSFWNPRATEPIGNVGSLHPDVSTLLTLAELRTKLAAAVDSVSSNSDVGGNEDDNSNNLPFDPFDDEWEIQTAMQDLIQIAEGGDPLAQLQLGTHHFLGEGGFDVDHAEAVRWFRLAADQGNARAQFNLGFCCSTGQGMPASGRDLKSAVEMFRRAKEQNHPRAREMYEETLRELELEKAKLQSQ